NANHQQDVIKIKLQDLLVIRGIIAKKSGSGRRGGYEAEQVQQILKSLSLIQNIWTNFKEVTIYKKGKAQSIALNGRTFIYLDKNQRVMYIVKYDWIESVFFKVGKVFSEFLSGATRQKALLPKAKLKYKPYQNQGEKKLARDLNRR